MKDNLKSTQFDRTFRESKPLMSWAEATESEPKAKQAKWCHLVMAKPRASRVTKPSLRALAPMASEHFLHDDRPDFAYSATTLAELDIGSLREAKQ